MAGLHLTPHDDRAPEVDALAEQLGGRLGLAGALERLDRRARPSLAGRLAGRLVDTAYAWERRDSRDPRWWPQGVTSSADAEPSGLVLGRRLLLVSWYARPLDGTSHGSRLTVLDLDTLRYRHVLLVVPKVAEDGRVSVEPLAVHAGGIVWHGDVVHVAATRRGLVTCRLSDVLAAGPGTEAFGHDLLLPVRSSWRGGADGGTERMRFSFASLARSLDGSPELVAGEYARHEGTPTRLASFALDPASGLLATGPDGRAHPRSVVEADRLRMQGAVRLGEDWHVSVSQGPWWPGSLASGRPGALRPRRWALPMGPEDLTWCPASARLWSVSEHPGRRWVFSVRRAGGVRRTPDR